MHQPRIVIEPSTLGVHPLVRINEFTGECAEKIVQDEYVSGILGE